MIGCKRTLDGHGFFPSLEVFRDSDLGILSSLAATLCFTSSRCHPRIKMSTAQTTPPSSITGRLLLFACSVVIILSGYLARSHLVWVVTGPGNYNRIFALLVFATNLKCLPFAWSVSISKGSDGSLCAFPDRAFLGSGDWCLYWSPLRLQTAQSWSGQVVPARNKPVACPSLRNRLQYAQIQWYLFHRS